MDIVTYRDAVWVSIPWVAAKNNRTKNIDPYSRDKSLNFFNKNNKQTEIVTYRGTVWNQK